MSALPSVSDVAPWVQSLLDLRRSPLEHRVAASNLVLAYARATPCELREPKRNAPASL